jgi:hypothetical protein
VTFDADRNRLLAQFDAFCNVHFNTSGSLPTMWRAIPEFAYPSTVMDTASVRQATSVGDLRNSNGAGARRRGTGKSQARCSILWPGPSARNLQRCM